MRRPHDEARREAALAEIRQQVADGDLTVRQMTPEERARYGPARPRRERRPQHGASRRP